MIPRIVLGTQYSIPLEAEIFDIIIDRDVYWLSEHNALYNRIELIEGVWGVTYSGNMGDFIYLSMDDEFDTGETWDLIGDIIAEYVGDGYVC